MQIRPGTVVDGRYLLEAKLAETRFSMVFRGAQLSTGQAVAIKVLEVPDIPVASRPEFERRFRREMAIYSQVSHPHLVRLLDSGRNAGRHYLVLEYVRGRSLNRMIREDGSVEPFETKRLMAQCLDALSAGHARGIVHRDFKPPNVMVTRTGSDTHAVVLDFGLAGLTKGMAWANAFSSANVRPITAPGTAPGTPAYMAPEQLEGVVTPQSDIYAWGLVLLECFTGRRAVVGKTEMATIMKQIQEEIEIPSWLEGHPIAKIIRRATCKELDGRYASAQEALNDLKSCPVGDLAKSRSELPMITFEEDDEEESDNSENLVTGGFERLPTLPSSIITVLPDLTPTEHVQIPPSAPDDFTVLAPVSHQHLTKLYEDYVRVCAALQQAIELSRVEFIAEAETMAYKLASASGVDRVKFRIIVDDVVRIQPVPFDVD